MNLQAQIFGLVALSYYIFSIQQNKKIILLEIQVLANMAYGFQYLLLNAFSAACMSGVSLIRCLIFYNDSKNKRQSSLLTLLLLGILIIALGYISFTNIYSIIPIIITLLYTYAVWQNNMTVFRIIAIITALSWIFYNTIVGAYVAIIGSIIELTSAIISFINHDIKKDISK